VNVPRTQLTTLQLACIQHLVADGWSVQRCLDHYHIPKATWYNQWRNDGRFLPAIDEAKRIQREGVWASIAASGVRAAQVLDSIMMDPMSKESVRVQAATTLLDRANYLKAEAVAAAIDGADPVDVPAAGAVGLDRTIWLLDSAAAGRLSD
jgi:hypothetical protein